MYPNPYFLEKSMDAHNRSMKQEAATRWWSQPVEASSSTASPAEAASSSIPSAPSSGSDRYQG